MASGSILNASAYDGDAPDLQSEDEQEVPHARTSTENAQYDREVLEEEEEREELIAGERASNNWRRFFRRAPQGGSRELNKKKGGKGDRRSRRMQDRAYEEDELMWNMEKSGHSDKTSEDNPRDRGGQEPGSKESGRKRHRGRSRKLRRTSRVLVSVVAILVVILSGLIIASHYGYFLNSTSPHNVPFTLRTNGTHLFAPTTIFLSLDGFRASFLSLNITPTLRSFIDTGISPSYMLPSFPSLTFPNHYTLATGLYPESHGIVGNTFWDPDLQEEFYYTHPASSMQEKWWKGAEPIWVTTEKQGMTSAVHMWPGSEAGLGGNFNAAYVDKYNGSEVLDKKVDRILGLLDMPGPLDTLAKQETPRPQLIAAYVPDVDVDGHRYGPNSTEITATIKRVDNMLAMLFAGLEERNLTNVVNVVVVSDHGMATTDTSRLVQLESIVDVDLLAHIDGWPLYGLRPKKQEDIRPMYEKLVQESAKNSNFQVYLRDENMPERYNFANNPRIAPLWIVPNAGWAIVTKNEFDVEAASRNGDIYHPRGLHGYDHEHPLMRAIFVARGPAFQHTPGSRMDVFQNVEVYNIVCDSIGVVPHPNNGTLRLPLRPVGLHSDKEASPDDIPPDPPAAEDAANPFIAPVPIFPTWTQEQATPAPTTMETSIVADLSDTVKELEASRGLDVVATPVPTRPVINDGGRAKPVDSDVEEDEVNRLWAWITSKLQGVKDSAGSVLHKGKTGDEGKNEDA